MMGVFSFNAKTGSQPKFAFDSNSFHIEKKHKHFKETNKNTYKLSDRASKNGRNIWSDKIKDLVNILRRKNY